MRLKHLQLGIHLPHTSKYHQDVIDIYLAKQNMFIVDGFPHTWQPLIMRERKKLVDECLIN